MINLMAVLAEAQLYKEWVPMTSSSEVLAKVSHFRQLAEFSYKLPWPLYPRSMFIQACGIQLEEENACILTMSSTRADSWLGTQIKRDPNKVYIDVEKTSFYCKPLDENR